jgi:hypothetical protein
MGLRAESPANGSCLKSPLKRNAASQRVYTTLDPWLQQSALDAIAKGMKNVDAMLQMRPRWKR